MLCDICGQNTWLGDTLRSEKMSKKIVEGVLKIVLDWKVEMCGNCVEKIAGPKIRAKLQFAPNLK